MADRIADLSPAQICQFFYLLSAAAVLAITVAPDTAQRLLTQYGARSSGHASSPQNHGAKNDSTSRFSRLIARLTSVGKVPHSWFIHFYVLSLSCSVFWVVQFATNGKVLDRILRKQLLVSTPAMTMGQVALVQFMMGLQGARRFYEHLVVLRPSSSSMWVIHWLVGNGFYLCTSVSIWVEGSRSICDLGPSLAGIEFPTLKTVVASLVFLGAWIMQYRCHRYLARLKKYSLPEEGLFRYLVCPHYTCECLLYLSMAVIAAPKGQLYNHTLACAVLFVSINLGVTANGTKQWYVEKFGSQVQRKWKMIPVVF